MAQYNAAQYNTKQYNASLLYLSLIEAIASTDTDTMSGDYLRSEVITVVDNLQKYFNGQIFSDFVVPTDVLLNEAQLLKLESLGVTDARTMSILAVLLETMTLSDVRTMMMSMSLVDSTVLVDTLTKYISDKRLNDSIRLQDWLSTRKNPAANVWSD